MSELDLEEVKFDSAGLVPAIIQDQLSGVVLMLGWMNQESLRLSLEEGRTVFWSRSRQELWRKGETSGSRQLIGDISLDCDSDCLLFKVAQEGSGACHKGTFSCFD